MYQPFATVIIIKFSKLWNTSKCTGNCRLPHFIPLFSFFRCILFAIFHKYFKRKQNVFNVEAEKLEQKPTTKNKI